VDAPGIDFAVAARAGAALVPYGPALSSAEASEIVDGLRAAAEASVVHVAEVTGLASPPEAGPMLILDRPTWLTANVEMVRALMADAAGPARAPEGLRERAESAANGAQLGGALALLSSRILGQYLPFGPPRLVLVAPNVAKIERQLGVDRADFRLWICLHEQTHRLQFAQAPWIRQHLADAMGQLLAAEAADADTADADSVRTPWRLPAPMVPGSILDVVTTPAQRVVFDRINAVMSLMEGYADVMMDRVGPDVVPTVATIRERFEGHRARGGWVRVVNRLMGMDLKLAQYRDGAVFCRAVIDRVGVPGLNEVYSSPGMLPTLEEIHHPEIWLARAFPGS
jgi:coenzyme F420 biosynthesis associated uncharacterized protein